MRYTKSRQMPELANSNSHSFSGEKGHRIVYCFMLEYLTYPHYDYIVLVINGLSIYTTLE